MKNVLFSVYGAMWCDSVYVCVCMCTFSHVNVHAISRRPVCLCMCTFALPHVYMKACVNVIVCVSL